MPTDKSSSSKNKNNRQIRNDSHDDDDCDSDSDSNGVFVILSVEREREGDAGHGSTEKERESTVDCFRVYGKWFKSVMQATATKKTSRPCSVESIVLYLCGRAERVYTYFSITKDKKWRKNEAVTISTGISCAFVLDRMTQINTTFCYSRCAPHTLSLPSLSLRLAFGDRSLFFDSLSRAQFALSVHRP